MVRHGEHDGIDVSSSYQFAIIAVGFAVLIGVFLVDDAGESLEVAFIHIARGDDLAIFEPKEGLGVAGTHGAATDDSHGDALRRGSGAVESKRAGGNECGQRQRSAGCCEKTATRDSWSAVQGHNRFTIVGSG